MAEKQITPTGTTKKPILSSEIVSEFGDLTEQEQFFDPNRMDRDGTYTPGWSEMRRDRDLQVSEVRQGKRFPNDVRTLPVNLHLSRAMDVKTKAPDSSKELQAGIRGYEPVTKAMMDAKPDWMTEMPPGSHINANGHVAKGDCVYMVCSASDARKNAFNVRRLTESRIAEDSSDGLERLANKRKGADPSIERLPGTGNLTKEQVFGK